MPRNTCSRESEPLPQTSLDAIHFAAIRLVIVAEQMQHAVENQNLQFAGQRAAELFGISPCCRGRNGDVAQKLSAPQIALRSPLARATQAYWTAPFPCRKRQHVRRAFLLAKRLIHPRDLRVAHQTNRNVRFAETQFLAHASQKKFKWPACHAHGPLAVQDHPRRDSLACSLPDSERGSDLPFVPPPRCACVPSYSSYARMICCTRLCRTTSFSLNCATPMPSILPQTSSASTNPDFFPAGKSICVTSPVTTALELKPRRVRNIFICSLVVFCASSRITNESLSVRPRMNASGATSMMPFSRKRSSLSASSMSYSASYKGRMYGSIFCCSVPGKKLSRYPASTAGRAKMMRFTCLVNSALTAMATAMYVLPVPPGPTANIMSCFSISSMYRFWLAFFGVTTFLPNDRARPCSNIARGDSCGSSVATRINDFTSALVSARPCRVRWLYSSMIFTAWSTLSCLPSMVSRVSFKCVRTCSASSSRRTFSSRVPKKGSICPEM